MIDYIILFIIVAIGILALRSVWKKSEQGKCAGCSGCSSIEKDPIK